MFMLYAHIALYIYAWAKKAKLQEIAYRWELRGGVRPPKKYFLISTPNITYSIKTPRIILYRIIRV